MLRVLTVSRGFGEVDDRRSARDSLHSPSIIAILADDLAMNAILGVYEG